MKLNGIEKKLGINSENYKKKDEEKITKKCKKLKTNSKRQKESE